MKTKPTNEQVAAEIVALKALKPVGRFAGKTQETIEVQIDALENGVDETSGEWEEMGDECQMAALDAINWKNGDTKEKPSEGWGKLVES